MIVQIAMGLVSAIVAILGYAYVVLTGHPSPTNARGVGDDHETMSPTVRLSDGRHLAYKERAIPKDKARHCIIVSHAFADSKHFNFPVSQDLLEELQIYILSFDRAGYGESDPNPKRSVKSDAFDIQELVDKLQLGPKFYLIGISMGAYPIYGCLKYIPHRLSGVALIVPLFNYWWRCTPTEISVKAFRSLVAQDRWTFRIAHYAPWLLHWWMTQKWFPSLSVYEGKTDTFSCSDREILKQLMEAQGSHPGQSDEKNVHESTFRDLMVGFGKWEFEPIDIADPFRNKEGCVHIWQGEEDKIFLAELNRRMSQQLPWIKYHEIAGAGHLVTYDATYCEAIFRALVSP